MADLATQVLTPTVAAPTFDAATASDTLDIGNGRNTIAVYKNGTAGAVTLTVVTPGTLDSGAVYPEKTYNVAAGEEAWVALIDDYADASISGRCTITNDAVGDPLLTVAVVRR